MTTLYYNLHFCTIYFSFALAGHRGTCLRPLHIFALLCFCFGPGDLFVFKFSISLSNSSASSGSQNILQIRLIEVGIKAQIIKHRMICKILNQCFSYTTKIFIIVKLIIQLPILILLIVLI